MCAHRVSRADADALIQFEVQIEVLDLAAVGQSSPWIALINVKDLKAFHFSVGHPDELIDYFSATLFINGGAFGVSLGVEDGRIDVLGDLDGVDDPSVSGLPRMIHLTDRIVGMAEATAIVVGDLHVRVEVGDVGVGIESKDGAWNEIQARWGHVPFGELVEKTVYRAGDFSLVPNVRQLDIKWNGVWYDIGDNWWSSE